MDGTHLENVNKLRVVVSKVAVDCDFHSCDWVNGCITI